MNEKKVTLITLAVLGVIVVAGGAAIYYLQFNVMSDKEAEIAKLEQALKTDKGKVAQTAGIKTQLANSRVEEEKLAAQILPLNIEEYDNFINLLEDLRRKAGVRIDLAAAKQPKTGPGQAALPASIHKMTYDFSVVGGFFQLLRFLNLVEQQTRFMRLDGFTISRGQEAAGESSGPSALLTRSMKVSIYTYTYKAEPKKEEPEKKDEKKTEPPVNASTEAPQ